MINLYLIRNLLNGRVYVGKSKFTADKRWQQHKYAARHGGTWYLHSAIRKHGADAFECVHLLQVVTETEANEAEKYLIELFSSHSNSHGYNMTKGGDGVCGLIPWNKGTVGIMIPWNKGLKGAQIAWNKGKPWPLDSKQKMALSRIGKQAWNKGKKMWTNEQRKAIGQRLGEFRGPISEATKKKIGAANAVSLIGHKRSEAAKQKTSESLRRTWAIRKDNNPEIVEILRARAAIARQFIGKAIA